MTKARPPLTIENALFQVLARIGSEAVERVTGRTHGHLLAASDHDKREELLVRHAIALDLEHMAQGGEGAPIYETYGLLLNAASAERFTDSAALARHAAKISRETGEATAAIITAAQPGATAAERRAAAREAEQAVAAITHALPLLSAAGADPSVRKGAVTPGPQTPLAGGHPPEPP
jgi:hypothetical protein